MKINEMYIALEDKDFDWTYDKLDKFISCCQSQMTLTQLATIFKRNWFDCYLLYLDLVCKEKIEPYIMIHEKFK